MKKEDCRDKNDWSLYATIIIINKLHIIMEYIYQTYLETNPKRTIQQKRNNWTSHMHILTYRNLSFMSINLIIFFFLGRDQYDRLMLSRKQVGIWQ